MFPFVDTYYYYKCYELWNTIRVIIAVVMIEAPVDSRLIVTNCIEPSYIPILIKTAQPHP